jgi:hypothetical protein
MGDTERIRRRRMLLTSLFLVIPLWYEKAGLEIYSHVSAESIQKHIERQKTNANTNH